MAQVVARYLGVVEVASSSLVTPTSSDTLSVNGSVFLFHLFKGDLEFSISIEFISRRHCRLCGTKVPQSQIAKVVYNLIEK